MARERRPVVIHPSQRRQRSRWQRERGKQRAIIIAGAIALLFIVAIPAYGYWANFIAPPRSVVLQVDNVKYNLGYVLRYIKGLQNMGQQPDLSLEPFRLLQGLGENELIRSGALGKGVRLEPGEVDQEIRDRMIGRSPNLAEVPPNQLEREYKEVYKQYLTTIQLSEKEYRKIVEASLLRDKLKEVLGAEVPTIAKQARVSWIVLSSEDPQQPNNVSTRIKAGEDFAALAEEFSRDRTTAVKGGELGWVPEGAYSALDDAIFSLQPGETSEAVTLESGTYFVKVSEVDEARNIEPEMRDRLKEISLQQWLLKEREFHYIKLCFGGGSAGGSCDWQYDWLVKRLREEM